MTVSVRLNDDDAALFRDYAALHGLTMSELIRRAVLERINPAVIAERNLAQDAEGVLVAEVGGLAAEVGLKPGDILLQINGLVVETPSDAVTALQAGGRRWQVDVLRQGQPLRLRFRV